MRIACHFTIPRPPVLELDAAIQDGLKIASEIGGEINFLYPGKKVRVFTPRLVSGFHQLGELIKLDQRVDAHHVFSNGFYPYPIYSILKKPLVVSTVISLQQDKPIKFPFMLRTVKQFIVPTERDLMIMRQRGYENVSLVMPGIDLSRFENCPCASPNSEFTLLMASAPWNKNQFVSKGIDLLLQVMRELKWLRVVFLWRGLLLEDMVERINAAGMQDRVTMITEHVDVNKILANVHAAIVLAQDMQVIKQYPHSILESLAAGKPVIVSKCLNIAEFIGNNMCGRVIERLDIDFLKEGILDLRKNYTKYYEATQMAPVRIFSSSRMIDELKEIYQSVVVQS